MIANIDKQSIALSVRPLRKRRSVSGAEKSTTLKPIDAKTAEFLVWSNSYIARAVESTASEIARNGYVITPSDSGDKDLIARFASRNNLTNNITNLARDACMYGNAYREIASDRDGTPLLTTLPPGEIDYIRDNSDKIVYKNNIPVGYNQKRDNKVIAEWKNNQIAHLKFIEYGGIDFGVSKLQTLVQPALEYGQIRNNVADAFIRMLNVVHIKASGATAEELEIISADMSKQITSETAYVTSDRIGMDIINANSSPVHPSEYIEPMIAEVAAAFDMPIEFVAPTMNFKLDDFDGRKDKWLSTIVDRQNDIASMFETQIFPAITDNPVEIKFNKPGHVSITDLITSIGFAVQSQAMTPERAQQIIDTHPVFEEFRVV